jgi:hypothetical protein
MDVGQIMSIVVGAVGLVGFYFSGKKVWWSWYINIFCQILWVTFALVTGYLAFLATAAVYSIIFGRNAYLWTKEHLMVKRMIANEQQAILKKMEDGQIILSDAWGEPEKEEGNLVKHARAELNRIGEDQDVIEWFVKVIKEYASFGHSGGSHYATMPTLVKLLNFEPITPLTNDPDEWFYHGPEKWDGKHGVWQNKRDGRMFSEDGGVTYTNVDENKDVTYIAQVVDLANVPE